MLKKQFKVTFNDDLACYILVPTDPPNTFMNEMVLAESILNDAADASKKHRDKLAQKVLLSVMSTGIDDVIDFSVMVNTVYKITDLMIEKSNKAAQ